MEEVVREAVHLSEILVDALGKKFASASPGYRQYLAMLLEEKTKRVQAEWQRAYNATHPARQP
jgi:hypothetical protein